MVHTNCVDGSKLIDTRKHFHAIDSRAADGSILIDEDATILL
jgi:hypothetical protein